MPNHDRTPEQRIFASIDAMKHIGFSAQHKSPTLRVARQRKQPLTIEAVAEFLENLHPLVTEGLRDEAQLEEKLGEFQELFKNLGKFLAMVKAAQPRKGARE